MASRAPSRRSVVRGVAWSAPGIALATASPAFAGTARRIVATGAEGNRTGPESADVTVYFDVTASTSTLVTITHLGIDGAPAQPYTVSGYVGPPSGTVVVAASGDAAYGDTAATHTLTVTYEVDLTTWSDVVSYTCFT